jgi:hypothetical protein
MAIEQIYFIPGLSSLIIPVNEVPPLVTGTVEVTETLSTTNGTWIATGALTFQYQWLREGTPISGATSNTYVVQLADRGSLLSCIVTAVSDLGSTSQQSNLVGPVSVDTIFLLLESGDFFLLESGNKLIL